MRSGLNVLIGITLNIITECEIYGVLKWIHVMVDGVDHNGN